MFRMLGFFYLTLLPFISGSFINSYCNRGVIYNRGNKPVLNYKRCSPSTMLTPGDMIDLINNRQLQKPSSWTYNQLISHLNTIRSAIIIDNQNLGLFYDNSDESVHLFKYLPSSVDSLIDTITKKGIDYQVYSIPVQEPFQVPFIVQLVFSYIFLTILFNLIMRNVMGPGGQGLNPFNRMNKEVNMIEEGQIATTFGDVAGLDEAKEELEEIVDYLKFPLKYAFAGAKIPKGVLLEGPPGTGKTLLARAVAGEAGVSFISASGSEFIEMFVGVGAQRVRNLFDEANKNKPCVIFIDEIDAVGGRRGYGFNSGGNDEREQTLNQILTNMDGFDKSDGIIVLAATNRADTLDEALKRSGRFDRKVQVPLPDLVGRREIAKVHFKNKPNVSVDYDNLAKLTGGFSGADLATLANEAALLGVRNNLTIIDDNLALKAFEKMTIGLPKKIDYRSERSKMLVAVHEVGHALMVQHFNEYFKLQSVTMNANTAGAGGYTLFTPNDFYNEYPTKGFFLAQIVVALGGRAAEIVYFRNKNKYDNKFRTGTGTGSGNITKYDVNIKKIFGGINDLDITTGASGDISQANNIIRKYLELFDNFIVPDNNYISDSTRAELDKKVEIIIEQSTNIAVEIIESDIDKFYAFVYRLLAEKTINYS